MGATDSPATTPPTGKQVRAGTPRSAHAEWAPAANRRDPVD
ncbi:MAG: hypothetical protein QOC82_3752, partial [Frankiaceae bacterium]|nr:hypothetical protein [Frankiaceae bacterium]